MKNRNNNIRKRSLDICLALHSFCFQPASSSHHQSECRKPFEVSNIALKSLCGCCFCFVCKDALHSSSWWNFTDTWRNGRHGVAWVRELPPLKSSTWRIQKFPIHYLQKFPKNRTKTFKNDFFYVWWIYIHYVCVQIKINLFNHF